MQEDLELKDDEQAPSYSARQSIRHHISGGNVLIVVTILAFIIANVPSISGYYFNFWEQEIRLQIGEFNLFSHGGHPMTVLQFINDALMAIFFFAIGLEIKREVLVGELSSFKQALLPIIAAIGGMIVPVAIFLFFGAGTDFVGGAAIPMATDIAFSLGVLGMLRSRVPISLKVFLTTLAVVDDIGGIIVIAIFYSSHINVMMLVYAVALLLLLMLGSFMKVKSKMFYLIIGIVVWYLFLNSGIHSTIAGVLVAFCIPSTPVFEPRLYINKIKVAISHFSSEEDVDLNKRTILSNHQMDWLKQVESASDKVISPLQDLEDTLHPLVNYLIIPLFAFANAGIVLQGLDMTTVFSGVSLAIICGLVLGKVLGIFSFSWLAIKMRLAPMPQNSNWKMLVSVAMLGGIGFTVSMFIANLSFGSAEMGNAELLSQSKLGIVVGSILAGLLGYLLLRLTLPKADELHEENE
ncbi:MAG: Na+/H+ antiporter NhaA [Muribaculaceae bacterium]|nr:Na+/H+ antiporter NhaA [Muribaculaceae bacterium]